MKKADFRPRLIRLSVRAIDPDGLERKRRSGVVKRRGERNDADIESPSLIGGGWMPTGDELFTDN